MRIVLLMGTSSVGKSTVCRALKEGYQFQAVKNGDEYFDDHLATIRSELEITGVMDKLSPPMRPDEIMLFCMSKQLNIASAPTPLIDVTIENDAALDDMLKTAGFDDERRLIIAANLKLAKDVFDAHPGPTYEASLEKSHAEALDIVNRDKTVIIDFVPESTPAMTQKILDDFTERARQFAEKNHIDVQVARVLIYCPMKRLSENMEARNQKAEEVHNIVDKRVGLSPIQMLSSVATAEDDASEAPELMRVSRRELLDIVEKNVSADLVSTQYEQLIGAGDKWSYGFRFPEEVEEVTLRIPSELKFDCTINNTGSISPALLAKEMVDKLGFSVEAVASVSAGAGRAEADGSRAGKESTLSALEPSPEELLAAQAIKQKFKTAASVMAAGTKEDNSSLTPFSMRPKLPGEL